MSVLSGIKQRLVLNFLLYDLRSDDAEASLWTLWPLVNDQLTVTKNFALNFILQLSYN